MNEGLLQGRGVWVEFISACRVCSSVADEALEGSSWKNVKLLQQKWWQRYMEISRLNGHFIESQEVTITGKCESCVCLHYWPRQRYKIHFEAVQNHNEWQNLSLFKMKIKPFGEISIAVRHENNQTSKTTTPQSRRNHITPLYPSGDRQIFRPSWL